MSKNKMVKRTESDPERVLLTRNRFTIARSSNNSAWIYRDYADIAQMKKGFDDSKSQNIKGNNDRSNNLKVNLYDVAIKNQISLLNDNPNTPLVYAKKPGMELDSAIYQQLVRHELDRNHWDYKKRDMQLNMFHYGTSIAKLAFKDSDRDKRIEIVNVDPRNVVASGVTYNQYYQLEYIIEVTRYSKEEIRKYWGVDVLDEVENMNQTNYSEISQYNTAEQSLDRRYTSVYEHWEYVPNDPKYPNKWRYAVCTDYTLILDKPSEWDCGHPYVFGPCYKLADRIFGIPYIHHLIPVVTELNTMWRRLSKIIEKTVNPQRVVDTTCIVAQQITNEAGKAYLHTHPTKSIREAIFELQPAQIPSYFTNQIAQLMDAYQKLSGVQSITLGQADITSGTPSGKSLEELRTASQAPLRDIARNWKEFETELGTKLVSLIHQVYDEEQVVRITGSDAELIREVMNRQYMDVVKQIMKAGATKPEQIKQGLEIYFKEDRGLSLENEKNSTYMHFIGNRLGDPNDFDVDIKSGQDTPKTKVDMAQVATGLYANGSMDLQSYLEITDFPMKEKVLEKSPMWQAFKQFQQQQAEIAKKQQQQAASQAANPQDQPGQGQVAPAPTGGNIGGQ